MRKKEQRLWDRMRGALRGAVLLLRVENVVADGFPDLIALRHGRVTMIELKAVEKWPVRPATPVLGKNGLSLAQQNFCLSWRRAGGNMLVVVAVGTALFVVHGHEADHLNGMNRKQLEGAAAARDWPGLLQLL